MFGFIFIVVLYSFYSVYLKSFFMLNTFTMAIMAANTSNKWINNPNS
ncbi:hypothetical protein JCM19301_11 [Jejuia pallidilutea]|uniref:Uncharacterized protein n=1 Tax=Jejuia pallidilutea TaxID=504487 RepID=A0A090VZA5_9FLAO|nr:hypothetical protein JCM19301_11 [Jejuia pallidilutea]GAL90161.1 hypothetical protein JCM19538_628 [Jejuia pallidilutea]